MHGKMFTCGSNGHCGFCGCRTERHHNFCHKCGQRLKCEKCSKECDSSFNFCSYCGHSLRQDRTSKDELEGSFKHLHLTTKTNSPAWYLHTESSPGAGHGPDLRSFNGAGTQDEKLSQNREFTPVVTASPMNPINQLLQGKANVTCAVGAYSPSLQAGMDMNNNATKDEKTSSKQRYTAVLKTYARIVGKLRGEEDFQQPVKSRMQVVVTHVEKNGYFFWGQVISDKLKGNRTNIETLQRISRELQMEESRLGPVKCLGRCAALEDGVWYRAWNTAITSDGKHDVLYIDFGNTAFLSDEEMCFTAVHIWNLPPMAKPFRLVDSGRNVTMKDYLNVKVTLEIISAGTTQTNYVASVYLVPEETN